jgi:hypothetical protein
MFGVVCKIISVVVGAGFCRVFLSRARSDLERDHLIRRVASRHVYCYAIIR